MKTTAASGAKRFEFFMIWAFDIRSRPTGEN
jgi:hypothetical protein